MNTEIQFTPGPWRHDGNEISSEAGIIVKASAAYDALGADLDLIIASPDMYAVLKGAREYVAILLAERNRAYAGFAGITDVPDIEACLEQIDAALTKAEGKA